MSEETESPVLEARKDGVATLTLNRPAVLNAFDQATAEALLAAARAVAEDPEVRCVVLGGAGRAFMAGGDVSTFHRAGPDAPRMIGALIAPFHQALTIFTAMEKPLIAAVHGAVAGAGVSLMLAADLAVAADTTRITLAYTQLATSCDGGASWSLPRVVGLRKALEMALLNEPIGAEEALRHTLVNRVVPAQAVGAEAMALAKAVAQEPTFALGAMKRLLRTSSQRDFAEQLDEEAESFLRCAARPEFHERVEAFVARKSSSR